jgi:hypothetical protein
MSKQTENEHLTPQEFRAFLLTELEASKQAIVEISNEQLEEVMGGRGYLVRGRFLISTSNDTISHHSGPPATASNSSISPESSYSHGENLSAVNTDAARIARVSQWLLPTLKRSQSAHF